MSAASSDTASATVAAGTVRPRESGSGARSSHRSPPASERSITTGTRPASSSNVTVTVPSIGPSRPAVASANAVPTFGCPANGTSRVGVKMRTRRVCPRSAGRTNVLSAKLNSRVICCICPSVRPAASGSTASWLPPKRVSVKTSQMK
jgi:hypothetical protein